VSIPTTREQVVQRYLALLLFVASVSLFDAGRSKADEEPPFVGVVLRDSQDPQGVLLRGVVASGPAGKSGLKGGDVVTKVAGDVPSANTIITSIRSSKPGETIKLVIVRDGKEQRINLTVGTRTKELEIASVELTLKLDRIDEKMHTTQIQICQATERRWQQEYDLEAKKEKPSIARLAILGVNVQTWIVARQAAESNLEATQKAILVYETELVRLKGK
jgi:C-terminal processing protease CtpA/Prc